MAELQEEIQAQSLDCSDNSILSIATQMLTHMQTVEILLQ